MKLATRDFPMVRFREELPAWLQPTGEAYIEIDARPMGKVNLPFMAARNTWSATVDHGEDGKPKGLTMAQSRQWVELIYDTCIISWRTNLMDEDTKAAVEPSRENFVELIDTPLVEISAMFLRFQNETMKAAADVLTADEATVKN